MKFRLLISFVLLIFLFSNCKKGKLFDYRRKYTGPFKFEYTKHARNMSGLDTTYSVEYEGYIDFSSNEKKVEIKFGDDLLIEPEIDKDGTFTPASSNTFSLTGAFTSKSDLNFVFTAGGLGGRTTYTTTGSRMK